MGGFENLGTRIQASKYPSDMDEAIITLTAESSDMTDTSMLTQAQINQILDNADTKVRRVNIIPFAVQILLKMFEYSFTKMLQDTKQPQLAMMSGMEAIKQVLPDIHTDKYGADLIHATYIPQDYSSYDSTLNKEKGYEAIIIKKHLYAKKYHSIIDRMYEYA